MAGRIEYVIAHPNGEETVRETKGGKAPQFAVWALLNGEWTRTGWSYKTDKLSADKSAKSTVGSLGHRYATTRVLPTR